MNIHLREWVVVDSPTDAEMFAVQGEYLVADNLPLEDAQLIAASRDILAELREARTELSLTRTNIMVEMGKSEGAAYRWEGVPELLKQRMDRMDAAIAKATFTAPLPRAASADLPENG